MTIGLKTPGADADEVQTALDLKATLAAPVFTGRIDLPAYTLGTLPAAGAAGGLIFVSDANSSAGTVAFSNATNWIDIKTGLTVA